MSRRRIIQKTRIYSPRGAGTLNGQPLPGFDYRRTDYADGSFEEFGLPSGCPSKPDFGQLLFFSIVGKRFGQRKVA